MPRNVRNFWLQGRADGRESPLSGGPVRKDGGFFLEISQRNDGRVENILVIEGYEFDGKLTLNVFDNEGDRIFQHKTER
jgi:hypothetical protein